MTKEKINKILEEYYLTHDIIFTERPHRYVIDGVTCAGVSTIGGWRPKDFLAPWAAKEVVEFLSERLPDIKKMTDEEWLKLLDTAKSAYRSKSKKAADTGTLVHQFLEQWISAENKRIEFYAKTKS